MVTEAKKTETIAVANDRLGNYYLVGPDGKAEAQTVDPPWHSESLSTPAAMAKFVSDHELPHAAIFLTDFKIVFVHDIDDRRDRAICDLKESDPYKWLSHFWNQPQSQADMVRLLRITFRGCLPTDSTLLALIRNLKFNLQQDGTMAIQHGRESLGKSIMTQVTGEVKIPEEVVFQTPIYENHPFTFPIACALEIMPHEQKFRITPYPGEVRKAMDAALMDIEHVFDGDKMPPVYRGSVEPAPGKKQGD